MLKTRNDGVDEGRKENKWYFFFFFIKREAVE